MEATPIITVVVCTHNPRSDYLARTLEGLRRQTLAASAWELLLVDNASKEAVAERFDLTWHVGARHLSEHTLGLTSARLRGIGEARGELLVFVDDDNILAPDYLELALGLGRSHPFLGAWGGAIRGVYEIAPSTLCTQNAHMLAIREVPQDLWSNTLTDFQSVPCGAGMCIRRPVTRLWANELKTGSDGLRLGRSGKNLGACEDGHLALLSSKLGLGTGVFKRLVLDHLIPKERMSEDYLVRLAAGHAYSYNILRHILGQEPISDHQSRVERLITLYRRYRLSRGQRAIEWAMERARAKSIRDLQASNI